MHLGLGNFFRAHQAWYTHHAPDAQEWGIAAFTGRSPDLALAMAAQDGLFTLDTRGPDGDAFEVVTSVVEPRAAQDHEAWITRVADPAVAVLTSTVTEAGYVRGADGRPDTARDDVQADLATLREEPTARVRTAPARILAGLMARRHADAGPLTVVPCDNLPDNGAAVRTVVHAMAELVDPTMVGWLEQNVAWVTTMVDRITPEPTDADVDLVRRGTGVEDRAPVVTEPFSEWVLSGSMIAGSPDWAAAGAIVTDDVAPFEARKLGLLNGAHSLLAYAGSVRGHRTVRDAITDDVCRGWVEHWWDEASAHLTLPHEDVAEYRRALLDRFANPAIRHLLAQIAMDGSQKLPVRVLPTLRRERAAGRVPVGAARVLAAWVRHLRGDGAPVRDPRGEELSGLAGGSLDEAVARVLGAMDAALADDVELRGVVVALAREL
ncbi:oxidoreductase [Cellulomonas bogoriensis 69B4 = DSM 16987]|uniref:Oxidoreductase n=1 Tax=Cellulomonas bogoriensis 69B4 = DSM 16987 TaxID=1386082 RepID=A0A0A0BW32_9CELL|nr:oxidoreductase [Cellulomonas bogoriensis 69B4 = DSM 16987]